MKVLVFGGSGLLGRAIVKIFSDAGHDVVYTVFKRPAGASGLICDIRNSESVSSLVEETRPDIIVHCAGERRLEVCESDPVLADEVNCGGTENVAVAAKATGAWLVVISTDHVFDGENPPYAPTSSPAPLNEFGKSKLAGEKVAQKIFAPESDKLVILRLPVLYGPIESIDESAVTSLARLVFPQTEVVKPVDSWAVRFPTHVTCVANLVLSLTLAHTQEQEKKEEERVVKGILHYSSNEKMTNLETTRRIAKILGVSAEKLEPVNTPPMGVKRPKNVQLDISLTSSILSKFGFSLPKAITLDEGLEESLSRLKKVLLASQAKKEQQLQQQQAAAAMGGHGHSHGGKPCHGHGHDAHQQQQQHQSQSSHGHSHGGKPCHGHGHEAAPPPPAAGGGHSHNGVPCHGHGGAQSSTRMPTEKETLAMQNIQMGKPDEAIRLLHEEIALRDAAGEHESLELVPTLQLLVTVYKSLEKWPDMIPMLERVTEIYRIHYSPSHPRFASSLSSLGLALAASGQSEEAEAIMKRSLKISQENSGGAFSQETSTAMHNLALLYRNTERWDDAEQMYGAVRELLKKAENPNEARLALSYKDSMEMYILKKDYSRALNDYQFVADFIKRNEIPPHHPWFAGLEAAKAEIDRGLKEEK